MNAEDLTALLMSPDPGSALTEAWAPLTAAVPILGALAMDQGGRRLHKDNVAHTIAVTAKTPARLRLRLTGLFHDVGKPPTRNIDEVGVVTFYGHESVGAAMTKTALVALGYDEALAEEVSSLVRWSGSTKGSEGWGDAAVRRFAREVGYLMEDLLDFVLVDVTSRYQSIHDAVTAEVAALRRRLLEVAQVDEAARWRPVVSGVDLMERYGMASGREVGVLLAEVARVQRGAEADGRPFGREQAWQLLDTLVAQSTAAS